MTDDGGGPRPAGALLDSVDGADMSEVPDDALPTDDRCPHCHWPVFQVTTTGPHTHVLRPCGCRVSTVDW